MRQLQLCARPVFPFCELAIMQTWHKQRLTAEERKDDEDRLMMGGCQEEKRLKGLVRKLNQVIHRNCS